MLTKRLLAAAFGVGLGLLLAEIGMRMLGVAPPSPYQPDPICGSRLKPNFVGFQVQEGRTAFRTNSAGFRDREHALAKPAETLRLAVLGDSYCEALQVELEQTFWAILEQELKACQPLPGQRIEVLNAGVSGYGTAQELLMLRHYLRDYAPDVVVLAFLSGNDVRNNSKALEGDLYRPYFEFDGDQLVLDDAFRRQPIFTSSWIRFKDRLINASRLLTFVYRWLHHRPAPAARQAGAEMGLDEFIYQEPHDPLHQQAWRVTERLIEEVQHEARSQGAELVLVAISNGIQVHPDPEVRRHTAERLGVPDLSYPERRLQQLAERLAVPLIVLSEPLRAYAEEQGVYLHGAPGAVPGQGHWNVEGHRVAGQVIAQRLCAAKELWERVAERAH